MSRSESSTTAPADLPSTSSRRCRSPPPAALPPLRRPGRLLRRGRRRPRPHRVQRPARLGRPGRGRARPADGLRDFGYANLAIRGRKLDAVIAEQVEPAVALEPDLVTIYAGGQRHHAAQGRHRRARRAVRRGARQAGRAPARACWCSRPSTRAARRSTGRCGAGSRSTTSWSAGRPTGTARRSWTSGGCASCATGGTGTTTACTSARPATSSMAAPGARRARRPARRRPARPAARGRAHPRSAATAPTPSGPVPTSCPGCSDGSPAGRAATRCFPSDRDSRPGTSRTRSTFPGVAGRVHDERTMSRSARLLLIAAAWAIPVAWVVVALLGRPSDGSVVWRSPLTSDERWGVRLVVLETYGDTALAGRRRDRRRSAGSRSTDLLAGERAADLAVGDEVSYGVRRAGEGLARDQRRHGDAGALRGPGSRCARTSRSWSSRC